MPLMDDDEIEQAYEEFVRSGKQKIPTAFSWRGLLNALIVALAMTGFWAICIWGAVEGYKHVGR